MFFVVLPEIPEGKLAVEEFGQLEDALLPFELRHYQFL
jgi:hypothetical protein